MYHHQLSFVADTEDQEFVMMKSVRFVLMLAALMLAACTEKPDPTPGPGPDVTPKPEKVKMEAKNKVVAHRGGATEARLPDNSIAALNYSMELQCYASECDIYWTADNDVIVAHADANDCINGLRPWESTVAQIRNAGHLSNGEQVPTLSDFLDVVQTQKCTRLWLDIKNITEPSDMDANVLANYVIKAVKRACEIIKEKKAEPWCEFICTSSSKVMAGVAGKTDGSAFGHAASAGIPIGWMANMNAETYVKNGYVWANLADEYMTRGGGSRTIDEFNKAGVAVSVFNADSKDQMNYYVSRIDDMKAICSNYPAALLRVIEASGKAQ